MVWCCLKTDLVYKMKKFRLEDIDKRRVFNDPPERYFDELPGIIQAKTANAGKKKGIVWVRALKLVPAAALLLLIAFYSGIFTADESTPEFEEILSEVNSEDIIEYLVELDVTNEEILTEVDFNSVSFEFESIGDPLMNNLDVEDEALIELYEEYDLPNGLL